jgi:hypothetical protein
VPVVPTPFKEYVLQSELPWSTYTGIAAGGPIGTLIAALIVGIAFVRRPSADTDAAFAGVLLTPAAYSLRYVVVGRGHDGLEWQAAQSALGFAPTGHAVDFLLGAVVALGTGLWITTRRPTVTLRGGVRGALLFVFGIVVLVLGQVGNNAVFDRAFPRMEVTDVPAEVLASRE